MAEWYRQDTASVLKQLRTDANQGLSQAEVEHRLVEHGPNELIERGRTSPWRIMWEQLTALLIVILIIAAIISAALGNYKDAIAIMAIVILSAVLGFVQDYRAEKAMAALKRLAVPTVKVRRDGHVQEVSACNLVPGDVVLLELGNVVPADGRLLECANLRLQESALTGESEPVEKNADVMAEAELLMADRRNMIYMGTVVTYGRGLAVITESGMQTELGRIAEMIQTVDRDQTPLQKRLDQLGRWLAVIALASAALVFILGLLGGEPLELMFMTAISIAVAVVPEALPAVVTIALALGAQRMLKRQVLIRKLPAVETLGSVTVICSDKTGTLTQNRMAVTVLDAADHTLNLAETRPYNGSTHIPAIVAPLPDAAGSEVRSPELPFALQLLLAGVALCNDAVLEPDQEGREQFTAMGEPTEGALLLAAARFGLLRPALDRSLPRVSEVPFTSDRKLMTTTHELRLNPSADVRVMTFLNDLLRLYPDAPYLAFSKGAIDRLLEVSNRVWVKGQAEPLTDVWRRRILAAFDRLARNGMRGLGVAFKPIKESPANGCEAMLEQELIFVGLVGMIDPPRAQVIKAVQDCRAAGIHPVMITGDHPLTATRIARDLNIGENSYVLTGQELAEKSVEELEAVVEGVPVYARVSPEHKLKIVEALQNQGHIVAMTGDGVNDAPALKKANIGVAMGIGGTDVAKEAADMVLLDDNFASIVAAVEEGRVIYDNVRRYIEFSVAGNFGKILVVLLGPLFGMPLPLLPLQILWMNLVTDGLLALGLSVEPAERDTMRRPPHSPDENILGRGLGRHILTIGTAIGLLALAIGWWTWQTGSESWQTMILTVLIFAQIGQALAIRSKRDSLFTIGLTSNKILWGMALLTLALQLVVIYVPILQTFFVTTALALSELAIAALLSTVIFWGIELEKWLLRRSGGDVDSN